MTERIIDTVLHVPGEQSKLWFYGYSVLSKVDGMLPLKQLIVRVQFD